MQIFRKFLVLFLFSANFFFVSAQDSGLNVKISADLVTNYIWRGGHSGAMLQTGVYNSQTFLGPSFQPTLAVQYNGFELGAWGSTDFLGLYKEADLYASFSKAGLTLTIYDYYWESTWTTDRYFSFNDTTTKHILEGIISYKLPINQTSLTLTAGMMFFGNDKKFDKETRIFDVKKNNYSTYFELLYNFPVGQQNVDVFVGATPSDGFYGDYYGGVEGFGIVNIGVTGYRNIKISSEYSLPVKASFIVNPQSEKSYLLFGITF